MMIAEAEDFEMIEPQNLIEPLVPNISFELSEMPQTTADCRSRYQAPFPPLPVLGRRQANTNTPHLEIPLP